MWERMMKHTRTTARKNNDETGEQLMRTGKTKVGGRDVGENREERENGKKEREEESKV